jgi:hypothetical protein
MGLASAAFLVGAVILLIPQYLAIRSARHQHAEHVFSVWYLFGLSFVIVSGLFAYIYMNVLSQGRPGLQGWPASVVLFLFDAALDIRGEFYFVACASVFLLVPQLLAYFASGLYGCAHLPTTFKWIDRFVAWSLIKFFIILAGIMAAQTIFATYGHPYRKLSDIPSRLFYTSLFLSVSFTIFVFYCSRENVLAAIDRVGLRSRLSKIHGLMTRHAKPQTTGVTKSLEETIFDSTIPMVGRPRC